MNTFVNYLGTAALFTLVLLPALVGLARERRIDRELRGTEGQQSAGGAARPVKATRRPHIRSWARI
ncbi:hypothetical protein [Streptomyces sp. NPDC055749]